LVKTRCASGYSYEKYGKSRLKGRIDLSKNFAKMTKILKFNENHHFGKSHTALHSQNRAPKLQTKT